MKLRDFLMDCSDRGACSSLRMLAGMHGAAAMMFNGIDDLEIVHILPRFKLREHKPLSAVDSLEAPTMADCTVADKDRLIVSRRRDNLSFRIGGNDGQFSPGSAATQRIPRDEKRGAGPQHTQDLLAKSVRQMSSRALVACHLGECRSILTGKVRRCH